jgi:UDP-N-acetylmuramate--alanine ligase
MKKLNIGVLMGGMSIEKEVSFNSGRTVCDHLDAHLYNVIPLFQTINNDLFLLPWRFLYRGKISDFKHLLKGQAEEISWSSLKDHIDFLYIATHGRYAEDGTLQGMLEMLKIPYLGAKVLASALGMNKIKQKELLKLHNIPIAHGIHVTPQEYKIYTKKSSSLFKKLEKEALKFPFIVKPNQEGSSLGVSVVHTKEELLPALKHAIEIHEGEKQIALIEEKLEGMEYSCIVLFDKNNKPIMLPPTEVVHEAGTEFHDYKQKYMPGRAQKFTPARVPEKTLNNIQQTCLKTARILDFCTIARIDGFVKKDGTVVIVDPNSLSGMGPSSFLFNQAAEIGMSHTDLINHLLEVELHHYGIEQKKQDETLKVTKKKMRIGVLLGGTTHEKEISLESGRNICYKLSPHKYEVTPIFLNKDHKLFKLSQRLLVHNSTKEIEHDLNPTKNIEWDKLPGQFDFIFIGLHGGIGENGTVQKRLDDLELPYNGSGPQASALCMDKYKTAQLLRKHGIASPQSILLFRTNWEKEYNKTIKDLHFPLIVKPYNDGCSTFVFKAKNQKELAKTLQEFFKNDKEEVLIEEYIAGMELTVGVIGNEKIEALPPSQAVSGGEILSLEEKFLPGAGQNLTPAPLPEKLLKLAQKTVKKAYKVSGCNGYARIDCFYQSAQQSPTKKGRVVILEINTLPGMTPATCIFHQAAEIGIKPMDFIDLIISFGVQRQRERLFTQKKSAYEKDSIPPSF